MRWHVIGALLVNVAAVTALAVASHVDTGAADVLDIRDDAGQWGGSSMGITHQNDPRYQAKKILDLAAVPDAAWTAVREVRLSAFFCVRDYSRTSLGKANGLDEAFEVVVNGRLHTFPNNGGAPVYAEGKPMVPAWFDFAVPKEEFVRGRNEIIFRKAPTPAAKTKPDDYLYLGIDNTASNGNSAVSFDGGQTWSGEKLNAVGARGEYMVRLALLSGARQLEIVWRPAGLTDPAHLIVYAGQRPGTHEVRLEWAPHAIDSARPVVAVVETADTRGCVVNWLDADGKPLPPVKGSGPRFETALAGKRTSGCVVMAGDVQAVTVRAARGYHAPELPINICPTMAPPAGIARQREPACQVGPDSVTLENATLRCRFTTAGRLQVVSLFNELAQAEAVRQPGQPDLFRIEVGTNQFSGSQDFECRSVRAEGSNGFVADLFLPANSLAATLTGTMDADGLHLALVLANRGPAPVDFKVAFPHLAGLALSSDPADDYYFFPRGGGIIADQPALIRQGYGDHQALYQVLDLFSPALGAGLSLRVDDADGRYKIFALQKQVPGRAADQTLTPLCPTKAEFQFAHTFEPVPGTSLACEYLRRTRGPGGSFAPAPAVIAAHPGNWKQPLDDYAAWAHRVWAFRPYPSRLDRVTTMIAVGWGQDVLFKDGKYRTDFLKPGRDCLELMSWWEWSPLGPWSTPFDQLKAKLGAVAYARWQPYFVKDPVTGQTLWNNQPGDYDGYNARFGGLPAFRQAVQHYKDSGALITLYTDPFRMDDASKIGRQHGREWAVIKADGEYAKGYEVWNPCHDLAAVRQWVADTMGRVLRETGADGIRLDEYGHRGWGCYNPAHRHTFAEPGCTEWMRATAEATKQVRAAMDRINPRAVLTTEHPGYDYLMQYLEGCITYDLTVQATPLRPLECNSQRFYFPECKAYELDHRGADRDFHKRFWNMVAAFGAEYPPAMYAILKEHNDVLRGPDCEPLVPTLQPLVYANRFGSGKKTLWTLYNATGHTVDGPVLEVEVAPGQQVVELLSGQELVHDAVGRQSIRLYLARNGVACVARLPRDK